MPSIPVTVMKMEEKPYSRIDLPLPSQGANFRQGWQSSDTTKCIGMKNIIPSDTCIKTSGAFISLSSTAVWEGAFHSISSRPYCDRMIVHAGTALYSFSSENSELVLLYEGVPDSSSMFCEFASKLYFYSNTYVFSIDRQFNVNEELPKAPLIIDDVENEYGTQGNKKDLSAINLIAPRVSVAFRKASSTVFELPDAYLCDVTRPIKAFIDGEEVKISKSKCTELKIVLANTSDNDIVVVEYYLKNPKNVEFDGFFSNCTRCISYGGTGAGGTRIIAGVSSDTERRGEYCTSELADPLYFPKSNIEKLGDGCDGLTGFVKAGDNLMIFTDSSVYKMSYSMTTEGGVFSTCQINNVTGCDAVDSIMLVNNRVVFVKQSKGVFTVDFSDETGFYNVMPLSGNINDGENGLLTCSREELKNAYAVDYDGKYILSVGARLFVWDYSRCGYSKSQSYEKSQGRLVWYICDGKENGVFFSIGRDLYCLTKNDGIVSKYCTEDNDGHNAADREYELVTEQYDFGSSMHRKIISDVYLGIKMKGGGKISLTFLNDGTPYYTTVLMCATNQKTIFHIIPPLVPMGGFSYKLSSRGTPFELTGAAVKLRKV